VSSTLVSGALTAAAIAGASVLLFTEVETILQVLLSLFLLLGDQARA
jgi:hypothetical protein